MNFFSRISIISITLMISFGVSSCSSKSVVISDSISENSKKLLFESKGIYEVKAHPEFLDLLGESVAVFSVFSDKNTPAESAMALHSLVVSKVEKNSVFASVLDDESLTALLNQNTFLSQKKEIYLDSITAVSVSDRDISNPLGAQLNIDNFLIYQLDRWPCQDCETPVGLRMKLRVVDAKTGLIIWTGISESRKLTDEESKDLDATVTTVTNQLTDAFYNVFKKKWHRKRFEGLQNS